MYVVSKMGNNEQALSLENSFDAVCKTKFPKLLFKKEVDEYFLEFDKKLLKNHYESSDIYIIHYNNFKR